jgi:DNA ligase (NAD+)
MNQSIAQKISALRQEIKRHNYNYYTLDAPTITDAESFYKKMVLH